MPRLSSRLRAVLWPDDKAFRLIFIMACALALAYNFAVLVGFGPDEPRHMNYVKLLLHSQLPVIENADPNHYQETGGAHAFHPPLYYAILLPFYLLTSWLPGDLGWHVVRLVSSVLCLLALPLTYDLALFGSKGNREVARLTTGTLAFCPIWGMTAGIINNDAAALFFVALFLWLLTVQLRNRSDIQAAALLGLVLGLGGLCKATVLLCGGVALLVALATRGQAKNGAAWKSALITLGLGALLVSPWHIRSMLLYGTWTPLPPAAPWFNPPLHGLELWLHPATPGIVALCNWAMFYTLWSQRDWLLQHQTLPIGQLESTQLTLYLVLAGCCLLAVVGHVRRLIQRDKAKSDPEPTESKVARRAAYGAFVLTWLTVLQVAVSLHQGWAEGGRYLLPAFGGWSLFLARGWQSLFAGSLRVFTYLWLCFLLSLNALALYWLLAFLNPTYGPK